MADTQTPYSPDERLADRLKVRSSALGNLAHELAVDLLAGTGWWVGSLPANAAAVVSDHVAACITSIETNLVEAALHADSFARVDADLATAIAPRIEVLPSGSPGRLHHPAVTPAHDVLHAEHALHVAGFFRAITAAFDCLAAAIIFVGALKRNVIKADLPRTLEYLTDKRAALTTEQKEVAAAIDTEMANAGPTGWTEWVDGMRNALMHRGRRLTVSMLTPHGIVDASGTVAAVMTHHFPQEPTLTDMESLLDNAPALGLAETATESMQHLLQTCLRAVGGVATVLAKFWMERRAAPSLVTQPAEQLSGVTVVRRFVGFTRRGSQTLHVAHVHPNVFARLRVAKQLKP